MISSKKKWANSATSAMYLVVSLVYVKKLPCGILVDMILRRDRYFYRETTADSSTKPR